MPTSVKFELFYFENQLQYDLHPKQVAATMEITPLDILEPQLTLEGIRVLQELRNVVIRGYADDHLERYFKQHQQYAIHLMNLADSYTEIHEVYGLIYKILASILDAIEQNYSKYFDLSAMAPDSYYKSSSVLITAEREQLYIKMKARKVAPALQEIILSYLRNFC